MRLFLFSLINQTAPEPTTEQPQPQQTLYAGLSLPVFIAIITASGVALVVLVTLAVVFCYRRRKQALDVASKAEKEFLSPPKPKNPSLSRTASPTQTVASPRRGKSAVQQKILEQAVNDLV